MSAFFNPPRVSQPIPGEGFCLVITQVDLAKMEGAYRLFYSYEEAMEWKHESSLKTHPNWHLEHCIICKRLKSRQDSEI